MLCSGKDGLGQLSVQADEAPFLLIRGVQRHGGYGAVGIERGAEAQVIVITGGADAHRPGTDVAGEVPDIAVTEIVLELACDDVRHYRASQ